jgi:hypothetical protein
LTQLALTKILDHYLDQREWMPVRAFHKEFGGKEAAEELLESAGGSIVFRTDETGYKSYRLTLLGVLLAEKGSDYLELIAKYLRFAKEKAYQEPKRTHIHSSEVMEALDLDQMEIDLLGWLLRYGWLSSGGSFSADNWNVGIPELVEEIPDDAQAFIAQKEASRFNPSISIDPISQPKLQYKGLKQDTRSGFAFVQDQALRERINSDWSEAVLAFDTGAWKCALILSGGVLEAMLVAKLKETEEVAENAYAKLNNNKPSRRLEEWRLVDLVDVASHLGLITQSSSHLSHALRHFRNLIHPTRHVKEDIEISKDTASVAINSIRLFIREFSE